MEDSNIAYIPEENTGLVLKGEAITEIESRLRDYSVLDGTGYRRASKSDLPENSIIPENLVYIQEYEIPYFEGDDPLNPTSDTASLYSIAGPDAQYFIAEEEVSRHLPDLDSKFYEEPR